MKPFAQPFRHRDIARRIVARHPPIGGAPDIYGDIARAPRGLVDAIVRALRAAYDRGVVDGYEDGYNERHAP